MATIHHYEVWTNSAGTPGVWLISGNKWKCNAYVRQAVKKGANPRHLTIIPVFYPRKKGQQ